MRPIVLPLAALALSLAAAAAAKPAPRPEPPKDPSLQEWEASMRQIERSMRLLEETQKAVDDLIASFGMEISTVASVAGAPILPQAPDFSVRPAGRAEVLTLRPGPAGKKGKLRARALTGNADKRKNKFVVLDFWAAWCGPCRATMPELDKIQSDYRAKGVEVVGIAVNTPAEDFKKLAKGLSYTLAQDDAANSAASAYEVANLPTLLVLDPEGRVVHREVGVSPTFAKDLRALLDALVQNP